MFEDNELECLADRVAAGTSCFVQGIAGTGKTFWCMNTLIPRLGDKRYECLAPTNRPARNLTGDTLHLFFGLITPKEDDDETHDCQENAPIERTFLGVLRGNMPDFVEMARGEITRGKPDPRGPRTWEVSGGEFQVSTIGAPFDYAALTELGNTVAQDMDNSPAFSVTTNTRDLGAFHKIRQMFPGSTCNRPLPRKCMVNQLSAQL